MRKLDPQTFRAMPWKNGGGTTTELLTLPEGASLDAFEARVSVAHVAVDGPFSLFAGIDRTLVVTSGAGLTLHMADDADVTLDASSRPFVFTGDDPCTATLKDGPITDLNVMTRRAALRHHAVRVTLDADRSLTCTGALTVLVVLTGDLVAADDDGELALGKGDVLTLSPGDPLVVVRAKLPSAPLADVLLVDFMRR
jgi:environmental stress-induced protein Ves